MGFSRSKLVVKTGMIIIHFYVVNFTTPILGGIILEKAENCKEFLFKFNK
jgi:hypothetical protein